MSTQNLPSPRRVAATLISDTRIAEMPDAGTLIAETHWEARWIASEGVFDPSYERTTEALRRWVDGMEQALIARVNRRARATNDSAFLERRAQPATPSR